MKRQGLIAGFALAAAMALSPYGISAAPATGPAIGDKATDGTVYAGLSPDTNKPLYTTPADAPGTYTLSGAEQYCAALQTSDHRVWHVPTKDELNTLYQNRDKGKLAGTFNETGSLPAGWYQSSTSLYFGSVWAQRFSDGLQRYNFKGNPDGSSLRCVR